MAMLSARAAAAKALVSVFDGGGYSNLVLDNILETEGLSSRDRSFCAALFYTTVQRTLTLDYAMGGFLKKPAKDLAPVVLACLRCGFCQLLFMPGVPESAAVNETVAAVKALGEEPAAGLVNGVLRAFVRAGKNYPTPKDKLTALSVQYSVPMPLIQLWRKAYGHETTLQLLDGLDGTPNVFLRANPYKTSPEVLIKALVAENITGCTVPEVSGAVLLERASGGLTNLKTFQNGFYHVQDISGQRMLTAVFASFANKPGPASVLDVCAAPGGKSFTAAQLAPKATITACDLYPQRVALIREGAARLGLKNITTRVRDALKSNPKDGLYDLVLCDVVCSGFGILRRKPEIRYKPLETLDGLPDIQYNILSASSGCCSPGGRLVYSTCTLNPAENEQVVQRFLEAHPEFTPMGAAVTLLPGDLGGDGFFYQMMERGQ